MPRMQAQPKPTQSTAQQLSALIKSARDIMRKDKGLNGDLDRLPMLTWIMFLKFLDDKERQLEEEASLAGAPYKSAIAPPYRWRDWAASEQGITGDELIAFVNQQECTRPDGTRGPGLFTYLRSLQSDNGRDRRDVIASVYGGVVNRMTNGYLLRDVVNKVNAIHFDSSNEIHTLGNLYESMLREMRDAAGDSGEFYTPRAVVKFMVAALDPRLGETVLDPACGTGGFLAESYTHMERQVKSVEQRRTLQEATLFGQEAKSLPYLLAQMNLLLHGLESPNIRLGNSLAQKIAEIGDRERVDIILTNPPFGGEEETGIKANFPADLQTAETALLFLQLIMRRLRRPATGMGGRAGVIVPNGTLFGDGVSARIKKQLLEEYNLHTIVRLPNGVFAPYTSIPTNLLFFTRGAPTGAIWYYELPPPAGRKQYTKTKPIQYEDFADCLAWFNTTPRAENAQAWRVDFAAKHAAAKAQAQPHWDVAEAARSAAADADNAARRLDTELRAPAATAKAQAARRTLEAQRDACRAEAESRRQSARDEQAAGDALYWPVFNLDSKNPSSADDLEHMPPEQLIEDILAKEAEIVALLREIQAELGTVAL